MQLKADEHIVPTALLQELHLILNQGVVNPVSLIVQVFELTGELDPDAARAAFTMVLRRHESLRMRFPVELRPRSAVLSSATAAQWPIPCRDLRALPPDARQARLDGLLAVLGSTLDVGAGPLHEALLVRMDDTRWILGFAVDHAVFDGISLEIFWREVSAAYRHFDPGRAVPGYLSCAATERAQLCGVAQPSPSAAHWVAEFAAHKAFLPAMDLDPDLYQPEPGPGPYLALRRTVPARSWSACQRLAREHRTSPYTILLGAALTALRRVSVRDSVGFRIPVAGRDRPGTEDVIGLFAPSMPLFFEVPADATLLSQLDRVRDALVPLVQHAMPLTALAAHAGEVAGVAVRDDDALRRALQVPHAVFIADLTAPPGPEFAGTRRRPVEPPAAAGVTGSTMLSVVLAPVGSTMRVTVGGSTGVYRPALHETFIEAMLAELTSVG